MQKQSLLHPEDRLGKDLNQLHLISEKKLNEHQSQPEKEASFQSKTAQFKDLRQRDYFPFSSPTTGMKGFWLVSESWDPMCEYENWLVELVSNSAKLF